MIKWYITTIGDENDGLHWPDREIAKYAFPAKLLPYYIGVHCRTLNYLCDDGSVNYW